MKFLVILLITATPTLANPNHPHAQYSADGELIKTHKTVIGCQRAVAEKPGTYCLNNPEYVKE